MAGLQVVSSSGQPGKDANIVLRGIGSISASNNALIEMCIRDSTKIILLAQITLEHLIRPVIRCIIIVTVTISQSCIRVQLAVPANKRILRNENGYVFCSLMNEPFEYRSSGVF